MHYWQGKTISCRWHRHPPGHKRKIHILDISGMIIVRAHIRMLDEVKPGVMAEERAGAAWACCLVHYAGEWETPGREILA